MSQFELLCFVSVVYATQGETHLTKAGSLLCHASGQVHRGALLINNEWEKLCISLLLL